MIYAALLLLACVPWALRQHDPFTTALIIMPWLCVAAYLWIGGTIGALFAWIALPLALATLLEKQL